MDSTSNFLRLTEAKTKELVPVLNGLPLHSLHNPRREAEVFANNHLAQLSKTPNVLILGLGFAYHIEEMIKVIQLRHKDYQIGVIEPHKEVFRLWESYQKKSKGIEIYCSKNVDELYDNEDLCRFLLKKPVVIIHQPSYDSSKEFFKNFLCRKASQNIEDLKINQTWWDEWLATQPNTPQALLESSSPTSNWYKAFWELKHAE
ncbi:MAG: hypothetical protein K2P81_04885 [Bacteriovoracaceae bacterium]|nr:hypothetical protein [Bacteriovoracaceae bacterium]